MNVLLDMAELYILASLMMFLMWVRYGRDEGRIMESWSAKDWIDTAFILVIGPLLLLYFPIAEFFNFMIKERRFIK